MPTAAAPLGRAAGSTPHGPLSPPSSTRGRSLRPSLELLTTVLCSAPDAGRGTEGWRQPRRVSPGPPCPLPSGAAPKAQPECSPPSPAPRLCLLVSARHRCPRGPSPRALTACPERAPEWHRVPGALQLCPTQGWLQQQEHQLRCCFCVVTDNRRHSGMRDTSPAPSKLQCVAPGTRWVPSPAGPRGALTEPGRRVLAVRSARAAAGTRTTERLMSDLFIFLQLCVIDLSDLGQFGSVI